MTADRSCATAALTLLLLAVGHSGGSAQERAVPPADAGPVSSLSPSLYGGLSYRHIGPSRGGRVTAVAGHRTLPNTFWFGSTGGGVWETSDAGASWRNITDGQLAVGSIGAVEVAESNPDVMWIGTGSAAIRSNVSIGNGVYRSTDRGRTWRHVGLEHAGVIADLVSHPTNTEVLWAAAVGNPFAPNPERGVFKTTDGGVTWQRVLFVSDSTGASDIAINPSNPDELYAGMWRAERKPWTIISGAREGGVYKSTDGGATWQKLANGLPAALTGKISISVARSTPNRVYALIEAGDSILALPGGVDGGVYRSDDAGATWTRTSNQSGLLNRPFYYTYIDADPQNPDVVYVNNEGFYKSTDGGKTFTRMATPHGDNHGMWINPDRPEIFIQSNDGGVNVTLDGGRTWSTQNNQPTAEVYQVDLDDRWPYWVYAGQQDNTTIGVPASGEGARSPSAWRSDIGGCETGPAVPQPGSNGQIFFSNCKGRFYRYSQRTGQATEYSVGAANMYGHNPTDLKYRFQRVSPIVVSPHDPNVVYHGSQYLHRTTDGGRTWETISPDLTANDPRGHVVSGWPITRDITGEEFFSTLYTVAESLLERGVIWTGANDGPVHVTRDNGATWTNVTPKGLPAGGRVQTVEASPHRKGGAYIAVLRYQYDDWKPYIYRTDDYGASWMLLTPPRSGFPQTHPARVVREDPDREGLLYAGTEYGAHISFDNGHTWQSFQQNLPATPVTDMKVFRKDLVIATQGRGFWIMDDLTPLHQATSAVAASPSHLYTPRQAYRGLGGTASIDYWLRETPASPITLEVLDATGCVIRTITSDGVTSAAPPREGGRPGGDEESGGGRGLTRAGSSRLGTAAGLNRFTWDLRHAAIGGRGAGPAAVPGQYTVRLTVPGSEPLTMPLAIQLHPALVADGITVADLEAQLELAQQVAQLSADAQQLQEELRLGRQGAQQAGKAEALRGIEELDRLVNTRVAQAYAQPMLAAQIQYLSGIVSRGDNRPGRDSFERYRELRAELDRIRGELARLR
jgi:photosystem II stability/assembly factor-like uncharacterized protein